jgi:hypothetical protein
MKQSIRSKIEHFQSLLINSKEFSEPLDYFLDEIAPDQEFRDGCKPLNNPKLIATILAVTETMNRAAGGQEDNKPQVVILQINKRFKLIHGACDAGGRLALITYFRELDMGVAGLPTPQNQSLVLFARFTGHGIELPAGKNLVFDHSGHKH